MVDAALEMECISTPTARINLNGMMDVVKDTSSDLQGRTYKKKTKEKTVC